MPPRNPSLKASLVVLGKPNTRPSAGRRAFPLPLSCGWSLLPQAYSNRPCSPCRGPPPPREIKLIFTMTLSQWGRESFFPTVNGCDAAGGHLLDVSEGVSESKSLSESSLYSFLNKHQVKLRTLGIKKNGHQEVAWSWFSYAWLPAPGASCLPPPPPPEHLSVLSIFTVRRAPLSKFQEALMCFWINVHINQDVFLC